MPFEDSFKVLKHSKLDVQTLYSQILSILNERLPNRSLSTANIFNMTVDLAHDLTMLMLMHVEDAMTEQNIMIAQKDLSVRGLATLTGHQATRPIAASGLINMKLLPAAFMQSRILRFDNAVLKNELNGLEYICEDSFVANREGNYTLRVKQLQWHEIEVIAEGNLKLFTVHIDNTEMITQDDIKVFVNGIQWKLFDSLYDAKSTDNAFFIKNGIDNQVDVVFGDGIHGMQLKEGDVIVCKFATTAGEFGNIINSTNFKIVSGIFDIHGKSVNVDDNAEYSIISGFQLGSNGEDVDVTRMIAGYSSRANVFTKPENLLAYLYRLSIVSFANVWTTLDTNIYNVLLLPNLQIQTYRDYLNESTVLTFDKSQQEQFKQYINGSGKQQTSTEIVWVEPKFKKYSLFIYIDTIDAIYDTSTIKSQIENTIAELWVNATYSKQATQLIKREDITIALSKVASIKQFTFDIFSEDNEVAKINGWYDAEITEYNGSTKSTITKRLKTDDNTNLGFDEFGDIKVDKMQHIPVLRAGFQKFDEAGSHILLTSPVNIFVKHRLNETFELI